MDILYQKNYVLEGASPTNDNDILIYQTLADYFIYYGVMIKENGDMNLYFPKDYEDIIGLKNIVLGDTTLNISGIIKENLSNYEKYKELKISNISSKAGEVKLDIFINNIIDHSRYIYVTEEFDEYIYKFTNTAIDARVYDELRVATNEYDEGMMINNDYIISPLLNTFSVVPTDKETYSLSKSIISKLRDNEIIIPRGLVSQIGSENIQEKYLYLNIGDYYFHELTNGRRFEIVGISDDSNFYFSDKVIEMFTLKNSQKKEFYTINDDKKEVLSNLKKGTMELKSKQFLSNQLNLQLILLQHIMISFKLWE